MEFSSPDDNRFALDRYAYESLFIESTGRSLLMNDENGRYYSNLFDPCIERGQDYLYNLIKNDCSYSRGGWELRGDFGAGMKEGLCLFYVIGESFFTGPVDEISALWGDMESGEVMFAPLPRDENGTKINPMVLKALWGCFFQNRHYIGMRGCARFRRFCVFLRKRLPANAFKISLMQKHAVRVQHSVFSFLGLPAKKSIAFSTVVLLIASSASEVKNP